MSYEVVFYVVDWLLIEFIWIKYLIFGVVVFVVGCVEVVLEIMFYLCDCFDFMWFYFSVVCFFVECLSFFIKCFGCICLFLNGFWVCVVWVEIFVNGCWR